MTTQVLQTRTIQWEESDERDGSQISLCGRFEASLDPVCGYWRLHTGGDRTESHGEAHSLADLARIAGRMPKRGAGPLPA